MATLLSYALTTVADVKESMGIASSDHTKDNLITRKINQVTKQIEAYCGRRFKETTYTDEEYDGTLSNQLVLKQRPITSLTTLSLGVRDTPLNEADWDTIDTNLYFSNSQAGIINLLFNTSNRWGSTRVTYSAGYATIPEDLAEAAASLAAYYTLNADGGQTGVVEKQEGSRRVKYTDKNDFSFQKVMEQLGVDIIIESYANYPVATGP